MSAPPPNATNAITLFEAGSLVGTNLPRQAAAGVGLRIEPAPDFTSGLPAVALIATNGDQVPRRAAWARVVHRFPEPRNLGQHKALGFWVEGDGSGALLTVRLESPAHLAFGAVADRYLPLDFTGPRFVTLVETESERWSDYTWDDGKHHYNVYRETIDFGVVESATLGLQNLPASRETRCRIGPIQAVPMTSAPLRNAVLLINGEPWSLTDAPEAPSGYWLECQATPETTVYDSQGKEVATVRAGGPLPRLRAGPNELRLRFDSRDGPPPRLRLTVFCRGEMD